MSSWLSSRKQKEALREHNLKDALSPDLSEKDIILVVYDKMIGHFNSPWTTAGASPVATQEVALASSSPEDGALEAQPVKEPKTENIGGKRAFLFDNDNIIQAEELSKRLYHIMRDTLVYGRPVQRSGVPDRLKELGFGEAVNGKVCAADNILFSRLGNLVHHTIKFIADITERDKDFVVDHAGLKPIMAAKGNPFNEAERACKELGGSGCLGII